MGTINVRRFGLAFGTTAVLFYFGCALMLHVLGKENAVMVFNSMMHGIDVSSIMKTGMSLAQMAAGLVQVFILGWLTGASIAGIYNYSSRKG